MKKSTILTTIVAIAASVVFVACNKSGDPDTFISKDVLSGYAQKGPFISGSSVTISELNPKLSQTGKTFSTTIANNSGNFEKRDIEAVLRYVELKVDGYYFNEVLGETSSGALTLYALADIKDANSVNVNVLTHLEKPRVEYLVKQGKNFAAAKQQAQREVLAIFGFENSENSSETLDLTNNAALLAISCILQGYLSTGDMMNLMANISADIKEDGTLDNSALGEKLTNNAYAVSLALADIRSNITAKYAELGSNVTIPDFESYVLSFVSNGTYSPTSLIKYPANTSYGNNILSNAVTSVNDSGIYSMAADVPKGMSLKIVLKGGIWYYEALPSGPINWSITQYDFSNRRQEFTVTENGKPCDLKFIIHSSENTQPYITIEYYENGASTPTKVKNLLIEGYNSVPIDNDTLR
ncbi:MAG: hypothetical protein FWC39_01920 [Bacteroidetes bacterium]|nr:hypothetical protein [Bacteroidota bacterium]